MATIPLRITYFFLCIFILLEGCTSLPEAYSPISDSEFKGPNLNTVRQDPNAWKGTRVRWGGNIVKVENHRDETWIEVVEHPLYDSGRPQSSNASEGRFIARIAGFLDPAIYAQGRQITVTGAVESSIQRTIGEYPYDFPVVKVDTYRLWEKRQEPEVIYYYPDPFWNSRFWYDRFYLWYPPYYYR